MNKDEEIFTELINEKNFNIAAMEASVSLTRKQMDYMLIVRAVVAIAVRLSIIASVWLFLFRIDLWYGILMFAILSLIFGGVMDRDFPVRVKSK